MEIIKTTHDEVSRVVSEALSRQTETCVYCVADDHCAVVGSNGYADITQIKNLGIRMVEIKHEGGTIVLSPGDVDVGIFTIGYSGDSYREHIINAIITRLQERGYDAVLDNNDILVDGKKVAGFGSRMFGNILYTAIHISIGINVELIQSICTKRMSKIPDGLQNYGITTTDILTILSEVFEHDFD